MRQFNNQLEKTRALLSHEDMPALIEHDENELDECDWTDDSEEEDSEAEYERQLAKLAQDIAKAETSAKRESVDVDLAQDTAKAETFAKETKIQEDSSPRYQAQEVSPEANYRPGNKRGRHKKQDKQMPQVI